MKQNVKRQRKRWLSIFLIVVFAIGPIWQQLPAREAKAVTSCMIIYYTDGGTPVNMQTVAYGTTLNSLPVTTKDGYIFNGWYLDEACTNRVYTPFYVYQEVNVLYAGWTKITPIALTVTYEDKTAVVNSLLDKEKIKVIATYSNGSKGEVKDFTITDSKVNNLGYNLFEVFYENCYGWFSVYGVEEPKYVVTFMDGASSMIYKVVTGVRPDGTVSYPPEPVKNGYYFDGWYTDRTYKTKFTEQTKINANTVVYAKWEKAQVETEEITYTLNEQVINLRVNQQAAVFIPSYNSYFDEEVEYFSRDSRIASVTCNADNRGIVTAHKKGKTAIYAVTPEGSVLKCIISVGRVRVTDLVPNVKTKTLYAGAGYRLKVEAAPANAPNKKVTYSTSDSRVAVVSSTGYVRAVRAGTCYITIRARDGGGASAKVKITVKS